METQGTVDSIQSSNILVCCNISSNIFEFQKEKQDNEINKRDHGWKSARCGEWHRGVDYGAQLSGVIQDSRQLCLCTSMWGSNPSPPKKQMKEKSGKQAGKRYESLIGEQQLEAPDRLSRNSGGWEGAGQHHPKELSDEENSKPENLCISNTLSSQSELPE